MAMGVCITLLVVRQIIIYHIHVGNVHGGGSRAAFAHKKLFGDEIDTVGLDTGVFDAREFVLAC
jgi:hypothetical protein